MDITRPGECCYCGEDLGQGIVLCDSCTRTNSGVWERYRVAEQRARVARSTLRLRIAHLKERQATTGTRFSH